MPPSENRAIGKWRQRIRTQHPLPPTFPSASATAVVVIVVVVAVGGEGVEGIARRLVGRVRRLHLARTLWRDEVSWFQCCGRR